MSGRTSLAATATCLLTAIAACAGDSSDGADLADSVARDRFGQKTCLDFASAEGPEIDRLPVIACELPHTHEIFHVVTYEPGDAYPGFAELEARARTECFTEFEEYVGINVVDSTLFYTWIVPTSESWNDADDRETLCLLGSQDELPLDRSMEDERI